MTTEANEERHYEVNTIEDLTAIADQLQCTLYKGKANELLLDLDDEGTMVNMDVRNIVHEKFKILEEVSWTSRRGGRHIVLTLGTELPPPVRIGLQAALGSDPKREMLALWEWQMAGTDTISLFKPK